jgi:hypothetical protein
VLLHTHSGAVAIGVCIHATHHLEGNSVSTGQGFSRLPLPVCTGRVARGWGEVSPWKGVSAFFGCPSIFHRTKAHLGYTRKMDN